jgi:hypothetical protein
VFPAKAVWVQPIDLSMPNAELGQVSVKAKYLNKPQNNGNHHDGIQDSLDLALHGYEAVDKPKQHTNYA